MKTTFSILILSAAIYSSCQKLILTQNERGVIWYPLKGYLDTINVLSDEVNTLRIGATVIVYDISEKKEEIMADCLLVDNSKVEIRVLITYKPMEVRLPFLHRAYGENYKDSYLIPFVTGCIQDKVKDYEYSELDFDALEYGIADKVGNSLSLENLIDILDISNR